MVYTRYSYKRVAFAGSAFASNEIFNDKCLKEFLLEDPCILTIRVYWENEDGSLNLVEIGGPSTYLRGSACTEWALGKIKDAEARWPGHVVTHELISN